MATKRRKQKSDKSTKDLAMAKAMIAKALALLDGVQRRAVNKR